ncbi:MAG: CHAD domain-containing protein [Rhodospirillaceae bacterium]|nr:CHAD domain-containing protein [Rhodospirillaceae bacterium]
MPYAILPAEPVSDAVQRIALEQLDRALVTIENPATPRSDAVYAMRKRCKKVRAVLRLARGPLEEAGLYKPANAALRDIAAAFSGLRDADVTLAVYDREMAAFARSARRRFDGRRFGPIRASMTRRRRALLSGDDADLDGRLDNAHWLLLKFRLGIADWSFRADGFEALEPGLRDTYGRVLAAAAEVERAGTVLALHEWRKRIKYHRNHLRILRKLAPGTLDARILALWRLGDLLGLDHDTAMVRARVGNEPAFARIGTRRRFAALLDRRRAAVQVEAKALAEETGFPSEDETIGHLAGLWNMGMNQRFTAVSAGRAATG